MKIYDFGIVLLIIMLSWMGYGLAHVNDEQKDDIMAWCEEIDQDIFMYHGVLIECNKEN